MKKIILFVLMVCSFQAKAQNNVILTINHKLQNADFALDQLSRNNIDHKFKVTRLEYYISEISITHDGGIETTIEDTWLLVNASSKTEVQLGEYDINSVEKIQFHIGVDPEHNHLDPSSYHSSHPLAPKSPSMHWGWTAGYRFVAYEGFGGVALNQLFQLHGLDDKNYFATEIALEAIAENNIVAINIDADYARALEDIAVNDGVIVHGNNLEARQCLENFRDFVFSSSGITSSTNDFDEMSDFGLIPNPITNGFSTLKLAFNDLGNEYDLSITNLEGKQIKYRSNVFNGQRIDFSDYVKGMYFVNLITHGQTIKTQKVIVQ